MAGGASAIAEILSHSDRQTERQILGELESQDSELGEQIRANLFTFDDVIALDARSLQQILRRVPTSTLAAALKGAQLDSDAMAHIRGNLTERGAQTLDEELEVLGAIRTSQVDAAQAEIVRTARELDAEGVIVIAPQRRGRAVTMQRAAGFAVAAPAGPRILDGQGLSVRRDPLDPGRPIDYARLSRARWSEGVTADSGHAAGYEAGYADGQREAETEAREAERAGAGPGRHGGVRALPLGDAAQSAYEERSAELERAVPRFAFDLLEALFGRESALAVDPGRDAIARALALDESTLPAVARLSPDDAATIGELADLAPSRSLTVVADPTVEPGGALVEIGSTTIDSQLSPALERVRAVIARAARGRTVGDHRARRAVRTGPEPPPGREPYGQVDQVVGMSIKISGVPAAVGDGLLLHTDDGPLQAEVVALPDGKAVCVALGETTGLACRARRRHPSAGRSRSSWARASWGGCWTAWDARLTAGRPSAGSRSSVEGRPPHPLRRGLVDEQLPLGSGCSTA